MCVCVCVCDVGGSHSVGGGFTQVGYFWWIQSDFSLNN